jgi:hypothetical protein
MPRVEHIIWSEPAYTGKVKGILKIEVIYHGGGSDEMIVTGAYDNNTQNVTLPTGHVLNDGPGIAGIVLHEVATLAD